MFFIKPFTCDEVRASKGQKKNFFTATKYERITVRSLNYQRDKRYLSEKYIGHQ